MVSTYIISLPHQIKQLAISYYLYLGEKSITNIIKLSVCAVGIWHELHILTYYIYQDKPGNLHVNAEPPGFHQGILNFIRLAFCALTFHSDRLIAILYVIHVLFDGE